MKAVQCKGCRKSYPCICEIDGYWAAHCMNCDVAATKQGIQKEHSFLPMPFRSENEATTYWNKWNRR